MTDTQFITTGYVLVVLSLAGLLRMFVGVNNWLLWAIAVLWPVVLVVFLLACLFFYLFDYEL